MRSQGGALIQSDGYPYWRRRSQPSSVSTGTHPGEVVRGHSRKQLLQPREEASPESKPATALAFRPQDCGK